MENHQLIKLFPNVKKLNRKILNAKSFVLDGHSNLCRVILYLLKRERKMITFFLMIRITERGHSRITDLTNQLRF